MRLDFVQKVIWKEVLSTFRDRRTLMSTILLPLIMVPLFLIGLPVIMTKAFGGEQERRQNVGVVGLQNAPKALITLLEQDQPAAKGVTLIPVDDATKAVQAGTVEAAIVFPGGIPAQAGGKTVPIAVHFKQSSQKGSLIYSKISSAIDAYARTLVAAKLAEVKLPPETLRPVTANPVNADTVAEQASGLFAFIIPMFILQWILAGGSATAIDATAGEKERGSLEALLVTPVSRLEVVVGKMLAVVIFSIFACVFSMIGLALTSVLSKAIMPSLLGGEDIVTTENGRDLAQMFGGNLSIDLNGFAMLLLVGITIAFMIAGILIAVCIFARSFKEAQTYIAPITIFIVIPSVMLQFADFLSRGEALYAIPLIGSMIVILDVVKGVVNWGHAGLAIIVNLIVAGVMLLFALRSFSREQVLFRN